MSDPGTKKLIDAFNLARRQSSNNPSHRKNSQVCRLFVRYPFHKYASEGFDVQSSPNKNAHVTKFKARWFAPHPRPVSLHVSDSFMLRDVVAYVESSHCFLFRNHTMSGIMRLCHLSQIVTTIRKMTPGLRHPTGTLLCRPPPPHLRLITLAHTKSKDLKGRNPPWCRKAPTTTGLVFQNQVW